MSNKINPVEMESSRTRVDSGSTQNWALAVAGPVKSADKAAQNAMINANKRFDYMVFPGQPHGYGPMQPYFNRMLMEYFAEHLIGDYYRGIAEIKATP